MEFTAAAPKYDRFMGRYSTSMAPGFADAAGVTGGMTVVDVGCGPGALTEELARRVGAASVAAIDPAPRFVAACRERHPEADVREGGAEALPWPDGAFDAALCSLVIAFMRDPEQGLREMARVTRPGGTVAACMWDTAGGGMTMLSTFWAAARSVDAAAPGEQRRAGVTEGDLGDRFRRAGLADVSEGALHARVDYADFDDLWEPFTYGVGPAGQYLIGLPAEQQARVRDAVREVLPAGPFSLGARAWFARGTVAS
ncbi:MAG TPA: class I SAM-dependent methyltransferase [Solirubrobacteraceae bacterium]|jgi:SAM-dependent methyltransferase